MSKVTLLLTLQDGEDRTSFAAERTYFPAEDPQKRVIGQLVVEALLAMDHEVAGAYPLTCLAEALVYLDSTDYAEPDMAALIQEARRFLEKWEAEVSKLRRTLGLRGGQP